MSQMFAWAIVTAIASHLSSKIKKTMLYICINNFFLTAEMLIKTSVNFNPN